MFLNKEQKQAVESTATLIAVIAAAGSGKTYALTERIYHLVKDRGIAEERIKPITFTRKAAGELRDRLKKLEIERVRADTFHSFCFALINGYATRLGYRYPVNAYDEHLASSVLVDILISHGLPYKNPMKNEALRTATLKRIRDIVEKIYTLNADEWIHIDEEYKARLKAYNAVDYAQMISETVRLLRQNQDVRDEIHNRWSHLMIDEFQDTDPAQMELIDTIDPQNLFVIGDFDQCVDSETMISTPKGQKRVADLEPGHLVIGYRNGRMTSQVVIAVRKTHWKSGIRITTESGSELLMSPTHKIWAVLPELDKGRHIIYLMYRSDLGFRIGKTNKCSSKDASSDFGQRAISEFADKLWVIKTVDDNEEALFWEERLSLEYGIPTYVFNGTGRGINQDRIDRIFNLFGQNGYRLLADLGLDFDFPHWMSQGNMRRGKFRVNLIGHTPQNSQVSMEWTGDRFDSILSGSDVHKEPHGRRRIRKYFASYRQAVTYAERLREITGGFIRERLWTRNGIISLLTASSVFPGMEIIRSHRGKLVLERILTVEREIPGQFYDLEVDDCGNFFGNRILSHNSIYAWRGATPENIHRVVERPGCELIHLNTNYRCGTSIIEHSNKLISHCPNTLRTEAKATDEAEEGTCVAYGGSGDVWYRAGIHVKSLLGKYKPDEIAVLCRDNGREFYPVGCYGVAQVLKDLNVPFKRIARDGSIWESYEVRNIVYTLNLIMNESDRASWSKAIDFPFRRVTQEERVGIKRRAIVGRINIVEASKGFSHEINEWVTRIELLRYEYARAMEQQCHAFLDLVVEIMKWKEYFIPLSGRRFPVILDLIRLQMKVLAEGGNPTIQDFVEWWLSREAINESPSMNAVEVSTIHSYKGLQKRIVVIPGVDAGYFPKLQKPNLNLDEEIRIFYVGITRAEDECYVLYQDPSEFVQWAGFFDKDETAESDMEAEFIR